ncbi:hypothetical protein PLEOSDRAFT_1081005 [Pleurotus ostreatus PC15]|uniref:Uncharacterized protein n=1 Tax=Pleurotus ostreatus (strain PC15) TaxID=1137138 RepID=A0A067PDN8_PLEO1|nr:hypothetical protein PLEOSDRAFT_1081005 [Pleurotus ostreatus PC15]
MARTRRSAGKKEAKAPTGGKPWTTERQRAWLTALLPQHKEAQRSKTRGAVATFRRKVMDDFVQEFWKDKVMSAEERKNALEVLKTRLRDWFYNHNRDTESTKGAKVLDLRVRKKKRLAGWHAYTHLYYDDVLKPVIQEHWRKSPEYNPEMPDMPLEFRNEVIQRLYALESDEVKERIAQYIDDEFKRLDCDDDNFAEVDEDAEVEPEEAARRQANRNLQTQIDALPKTMQKMCEQVRKELGFVGVVCFVGPAPKEGGGFAVVFGTDGRTQSGRSIFQLHPTLESQLQRIVVDFAEKAIPIEKRLACALPGTEQKRVEITVSDSPSHPSSSNTGSSKSTPVKSLDVSTHQSAVQRLLAKVMYRFDKQGAGVHSVDGEDVDMAGPTEGREGRRDDELTDDGENAPGSDKGGDGNPSSAAGDEGGTSETANDDGDKDDASSAADEEGGTNGVADDEGGTSGVVNDEGGTSGVVNDDGDKGGDGNPGSAADEEGGMNGVANDEGGTSGTANDEDQAAENGSTEDDDVSRNDNQDPEFLAAEAKVNKDLDDLIALQAMPKWLRDAVNMLRGFKGSIEYLEAVAWFINFERHVEHNPGKPLQADGRPAVLDNWIHNGRRPKAHRKLTKEQLKTMCDELFKWWFSIQPPERIPPDFNMSSRDCASLIIIDTNTHEDWPKLYRGGVNGIYGVLVCLGWWLEAAGPSSAEFTMLVEDVSWVLSNLVAVPAPAPEAKKPSSRRR